MQVANIYFDYCQELFQQSAGHNNFNCEWFGNIGGRYVIRLRFGRKDLLSKFVRAFAHLEAPPSDNPALTVCIWDSSGNPETMPPYPSWGEEWDDRNGAFVSSGELRIHCDVNPRMISLYNGQTATGLFWINNIDEMTWYEQCCPIRNIIHWWALQRQMFLVHAACLGTDDESTGVLITGQNGAGKSTLALSSLNSGMRYIGDDLCLIGKDENTLSALSIYNTGKLEHLKQLPQLEDHVWKKHPPDGEKYVVFVHESFSDRMLRKVPIKAILVPSQTGQLTSSITPMAHDIAFRLLFASTRAGTGVPEFFALYRLCAETPCFSLQAGTDLASLNDKLRDFMRELKMPEKKS